MLQIPESEDIQNTIETHLNTFPKGSHVEIGFFGGNFTGIDSEHQELLLKIAQRYVDNNRVNGIRVNGIRISTRPDYINLENLLLLKKYNVKTIELGAQSLDKDVLKASGRGHKAEDIIKASKMITGEGFSLGLQMMIGLPGDTLEKSLFTAEKIVELGADNTRIYPTLVIKETKLEELYRKKKYIPLSLEEAVAWSKEILLVFEKANVNIIRMGLHPSEGLLNGHSLISGPFHISFRELVLTEIWHDILGHLHKMENNSIEIHVPAEEINYAIGYNAKNKKELSGSFKHIRFIPDPKLNRRTFRAYFN